VSTWKTVQELTARLPETVEQQWYGTPAIKVGGKGFVRQKERMDGVIAFPSDEKEILLASEPDKYFTTPHYDNGGTWLLGRLSKIPKAELRELLTDAWRLCAPPKVLKAHPDV
jgi:hypothetical protein